jgi:microcompartment protein CcmL/EutN
MLKAADVELIVARTICSGKYMVIIGGEVAAVRSAVDSGRIVLDEAVIDTMVIPNVHSSVFPAIAGSSQVEAMGALGLVESFSVASLIEGADAAVKAAKVNLVEIRLAMALGGKAFFAVTGEVSAVRAAVEAGSAVVAEKGLLVNRGVLAAPSPELFKEYI